MEKVPYQGQTLTRWRVGNSTFLALPEKGARLMNWSIALGDGSVRDVLFSLGLIVGATTLVVAAARGIRFARRRTT